MDKQRDGENDSDNKEKKPHIWISREIIYEVTRRFADGLGCYGIIHSVDLGTLSAHKA